MDDQTPIPEAPGKPVDLSPSAPKSPPLEGAKPVDLTGGLPSPTAGIDEAKKKIAAYDAEAGKLTMPELKAAPPPVSKPTDPISQWGSAAMIFAALGSALSRRHATTALDAASAVLTAFKAGNKEKADLEYKRWQGEQANVQQVANFQMNAYKAAIGELDKKRTEAVREGKAKDDATAKARAEALAHAFEDPAMLQASRTGGLAAMADLQEKRAEEARKLKVAGSKIEQQYEIQRKVHEVVASEEFRNPATTRERKIQMLAEAGEPNAVKALSAAPPKLSAAETRAKLGESPLNDNQKHSALEMAAGNIRAPSLTDPMRDAKIKEADDISKSLGLGGYNEGDFATRRAALQDWVKPGGAGGKAILAFNTVPHHLELASSMIDKLPTGDPRLANPLLNFFNVQLGDTAVTSWDTARHVITDEVVKSVLGTAGGVADRDKFEKILLASNTPEQLRDNIEVVKRLIGGRVMAARYLFTGAGLPAEKFDALLEPETKKVFQAELDKSRAELGGGGATAPAEVGAPKSVEPGAKPEGKPPVDGAKKAPDGNWYVVDPDRPGKYLKVNP